MDDLIFVGYSATFDFLKISRFVQWTIPEKIKQ